jgi:hypothetical protein
MALRDILVQFDVVVNQKPLEEAQQRSDRLISKFNEASVAMAGMAIGVGVAAKATYDFISSTVAAADDVGDLAARLGIATDEFQVMQAVAEDVGSSMGTMQTSFRTLASELRDGGKNLSALGVATRNADGSMRSVTDVFWDAGAALGSTEDQAKRLELAQKLLGRGGLELLPIFSGGADAIAEYRAQIAETAVVFDEDFIEAADRVAKQQQALHHRLQRVRVLVVSQLLPAFSTFVGWLEKGATVVGRFVKSGRALQIALAGIGAFIARWALAKNLGSLVGWLFRIRDGFRLLGRLLMRFVLPLLIVDELITLFRGGDTLIGRVIDALFGVGTTAAAVEMVNTAATSLWDTMGLVIQRAFDMGAAGDMNAEEFEMAFIKASSGIREAFDTVFDHIGAALEGIGEGIKISINNALDWLFEKIRSIPGVESLLGLDGVKLGAGVEQREQMANGNNVQELRAWQEKLKAIYGSAAMQGIPSRLGGQPMLSAEHEARLTSPQAITDARNQTVNVTVEGGATPATARQIAQQTATALSATDRSAIGAAVGL